MFPVCHSEPDVAQYINLTPHITEADLRIWKEFVSVLPACERFKGPWIMGGAVRRFLLDEDLRSADVDYFFSSQGQFDKVHNKLESQHAIIQSTKNNTTFDVGGIRVQLVCARWRGSDFKHMDSFDFTLCQTAWDGQNIWITPQAYHDILNKRINLVDNEELPSALGSYMRILKYSKQGYTASYDTLKKLINLASLEYADTLEADATDNYGPVYIPSPDTKKTIHDSY